MATPLPHEYEAALDWAGTWPAMAASGPRPLIGVGPPPEFGGDAAHWSPEHLLLSALNGCLLATFAAIARAQRLPVKLYESRARATLARTDQGVGFTSFELSLTVVGDAENEERLRAAVVLAKQRCFVAGALRVPVQLDLTFKAAETPWWASNLLGVVP